MAPVSTPERLADAGAVAPSDAGGQAPEASPAAVGSETAAPEATPPEATPPEATAPEAAAPETAPETAPATDGTELAEAGTAQPATGAVEPPAAPAPEATAEVATAAPEPVAEAGAAARPEAPVVEVPPGSEFARPKPETEPVVPSADAGPATGPVPEVAAPDAETAPALAEMTPAEVPSAAPAPVAPAAPEPAAPAVAALPAAEGSVPVPPPGEAAVPALAPAEAEAPPAPVVTAEAPAAAEESAGATEPAPEPAAAPEPAPEPAAAPEAAPPADTAPEAAAEAAPAAGDEPVFVDDAPGPPEDYLPDEDLPEDTLPAEVQPGGTMPGGDGGPVIIGVAPRDPFGAAGAPQPGFGQKIQPGFGQKIQPGFGQAGAGVRVNRPVTPDAAEQAPQPAAEPAPGPEAGLAPAPAEAEPAAPVADGALRRHAAAFANPDHKPLVAVVLTDLGEAAGGVAPDALTQLGGAVTIAIDPEAPDAAARASVYRLAGDEVAILAPDLPAGATASDLEVSYQGSVSALPEAVAVVGRRGSAFQTDRRIAQHLVSLLATEGRGLVTYTKGLDPARQAAEGEGLPHAAIFRDLDAEGENPATIQRFLDRAAFEAARTGAVVVTGTTSPGTVAALQEWIAAGAKGSVVGPVSAVMLAE
jgi:polysaccharide deacetylase 2 family uncharacterized protein YibQ